MTTHNRYIDQTRAIVAGAAFPTSLDAHSLDCAQRLAENARLMLAEAYKLVRGDAVLSVRAEGAGQAARALRESVAARLPGALH